MLIRHCSAFACPRRVPQTVLFCDVHFRQLPDRYRKPIARNRDVPTRATINDARAIITGTRAAVAYLAKKEVQVEALTTVANAAAASPAPVAAGSGSGAVASASPSVGGSARTLPSGRRTYS